MIVLDTNVISELLKPAPDLTVQRWMDRQAPETLFVTATVLSELLLGAALLSIGRKKAALASAIRTTIETLFTGRILDFDTEAAERYAEIVAYARSKGYIVSVADGQVAAVAVVRNFSVATRDRGPFEAMRVRLIDPWK